jgi:hypothetical protein
MSRWPRGTLYPQKLTITPPTSGGRSVGIVRSRTRTMEFFFIYTFVYIPFLHIERNMFSVSKSNIFITFKYSCIKQSWKGCHTLRIYISKCLKSTFFQRHWNAIPSLHKYYFFFSEVTTAGSISHHTLENVAFTRLEEEGKVQVFQ